MGASRAPPDVGAALLLVLLRCCDGGASCLPQIFLCAFQLAFWQSREQ
jgi:hypothetical protein